MTMGRGTGLAVGVGRRPKSSEASILRHPALLAATFAFTAFCWSRAGRLWSRDEKAIAASIFAAGLSLGPCLAGWLGAPRRHKPLLLRIVLFSGELSILAPLTGAASLDLRAVSGR